MNAQTDSLARAIAYLGAVEVAPGRYARRECPDVPFEIIPEEILRKYEPERIATFSHRDRQFCGIVTMPAWWTPERRFALKGKRSGRIIATYSEADTSSMPMSAKLEDYEYVTADLETGEEVPC